MKPTYVGRLRSITTFDFPGEQSRGEKLVPQIVAFAREQKLDDVSDDVAALVRGSFRQGYFVGSGVTLALNAIAWYLLHLKGIL